MYDNLTHLPSNQLDYRDDRQPKKTKIKALTSGWPSVVTLGPCKLCTLVIPTSSGNHFSNASLSGAFTLVCPATTAPTRVEGPYSFTTAGKAAASTE